MVFQAWLHDKFFGRIYFSCKVALLWKDAIETAAISGKLDILKSF